MTPTMSDADETLEIDTDDESMFGVESNEPVENPTDMGSDETIPVNV